MKTILTPVDFSPITRHVVAEAAALARALDARIVLLNITAPLPALAVDGTLLDPRIVDWTEVASGAALKRLHKIEEELAGASLRAESLHLIGSPAKMIVGQAKKLPADFIVIGSHGHTAFYDIFAGSATRGVLKRAPCPVLVVPARQKSASATKRARAARPQPARRRPTAILR